MDGLWSLLPEFESRPGYLLAIDFGHPCAPVSPSENEDEDNNRIHFVELLGGL